MAGELPPIGKLLAGIALILVLAVACNLIDLKDSTENVADSVKIQTGSPPEASEALQELNDAPPDPMYGYSRERFPHWSKASNFG
jgi:hypothetical protein